jgi:hypothetical protein
VDEAGLAPAQVVLQLPDRLDKGQALDVADRSADFADDEVETLGVGLGEFLDGVGDVRDDLDRRAQIVAAPLAVIRPADEPPTPNPPPSERCMRMTPTSEAATSVWTMRRKVNMGFSRTWLRLD